ncbi:hypothetical protein MRX96_031294 [Rhipicephalus microplus]
MGAIDRPVVLKQIVSATLATSADARGPQRTCDPHHESPDLRVTPHLQAEKQQGAMFGLEDKQLFTSLPCLKRKACL